MNTIEDFDNAPVGATATTLDGKRAVKAINPGRPWVCYRPWFGLDLLDSADMAHQGFTLDPALTAPTTAREALDLAWNLAHPVKEGQVIPVGTEYFYKNAHKVWAEEFPFKITSSTARNHRTLDPLPVPEPEWFDAPAVLAATILEDRSKHRTVFTRENETGTQWLRDTKVYHWYELVGVVPLYPKEEA